MDNVTHLFTTYRECARHLWNTYFQPVAEPIQKWDLRDEFDTASRGIFASLVLRPLGVFDHELAPVWSNSPKALPGFSIVPIVEHGTPILINRDMPRSGYWDHPISLVRPNEVELHLLRFFDFDELGCREYRYYEVIIHASVAYPEIVGRAALIEVQNAKVLFDKQHLGSQV